MKTLGFTFIEVLVAMLIFVMAVLAAVDIIRGSVRATLEAKEITTATSLLQKVIVDLETKLESEGFDKGCDKKKDGTFEPPNETFSWMTTCEEIEFNLSQTAAQTLGAEPNEEAETKENQMQKMILDTASKYITKSMREIHAEILWAKGKDNKKVDVTTHVARFDQPITIGGLPQ